MPPDTSNFDQTTFDYLSSPTPMMRERLIRTGNMVVAPLLQSLIQHLGGFGMMIESDRERRRIKEYDWNEKVFNRYLRPAHDVIVQIGEGAIFQLCKSLRQSNQYLQKAAALLLALQTTEYAPSIRTMTEIRDIIWNLKTNDTTLVMLLTFVLARGGDAGSQKAIETHARGTRLGLEQWTSKTMDTAVLELLGWE